MEPGWTIGSLELCDGTGSRSSEEVQKVLLHSTTSGWRLRNDLESANFVLLENPANFFLSLSKLNLQSTWATNN